MEVSYTKLLQNIFRCYENQLKSKPLPLKHLKALDAITNCRSERGGYSIYQCPKEDTLTTHYHSCRHRSCWLCAYRQRVVFTLPHEYLNLWRFNQKWFTAALFASVKETLTELIGDQRYHGITPGMLMVLHTWGRQLTLHPHIHCLVTGGGLDEGQQWRETGEYLLPIRVVKTLYRGKLQGKIKKAFENSELILPLDHTVRDFEKLYNLSYTKAWSVRIEEQYDTGRGVMLYLSRYMKGGPLNPRQIKRCDNERVDLSYKDHRDKRTKKRNHCREVVGGIKEPIQDEREKQVVTCGECGTALMHLYSSRGCNGKGNSNKESDAGFFVQQYVEAYLGMSDKPIWSEVMRV